MLELPPTTTYEVWYTFSNDPEPRRGGEILGWADMEPVLKKGVRELNEDEAALAAADPDRVNTTFHVVKVTSHYEEIPWTP